VRVDDVITEDLYAAGNRIVIEGRIEGDLLATAFEEVVVSGEVTGDVVVVAGTVTISGDVGGSVRASAGLVTVSGSIGEDLAAASWNTVIEPTGVIGRDLINWGRNGRVEGRVERDLTGRFSNLVVAGQVDGTVEVTVGSLVIDSAAEVEGGVSYRSRSEAEVAANATVGLVVRRTPLAPNVEVRALAILTLLLVLLFLTATGLLFASSWPRQLESSMEAAARGWRTWLSGLGVLVSPLVAAGILAFILSVAPPAAAVPLALILVPIIFGLGGLVLLAALFGLIPAAALIGRLALRRRRSPAAAVLLGMFVVGATMLIPGVRLVVSALLVPLGIGSVIGRRPDPQAILQIEEPSGLGAGQ
jgi:hypothetical protein